MKIQVLKDGPVVEVDEDVANAFCPTGKGGGVDPSCGKGKAGGGKSGGKKVKVTKSKATSSESEKSGEKAVKDMFPKITGRRGGHTARVRFFDEGRGEFHFDSEYTVKLGSYYDSNKKAMQPMKPSQIIFGHKVNYQGGFGGDNDLKNSFREGDVVAITGTKWTPRGRSNGGSRTVKVTKVQPMDGAVLIDVEGA